MSPQATDDPVCCIVRISGRVQGVGFRMWAYGEARRLRIHGWVRNLPDGSVEACLAATSEGLEQMIERLRQGPPMSKVDAVQRQDIALPPGLDGFDILP